MHLSKVARTAAVAGTSQSQVDINDPVWSRDLSVYSDLDSWTDRGERTLIHQLAASLRGKRILDVGMGAGRSAWLILLLSDDYVGVDLNRDMVEAARRNLPDTDFRAADARDLSMFADGEFDFVYFSHAGLDAIDHVGRHEALSEFVRVTKPGGVVAYSTLNRSGPFWHMGPGPVGAVGKSPNPYNYARFGARFGLHPRQHLHAFHNASRLRTLAEDHDDWGTDTMPTHEWALLVHYVTGPEAVREAENVSLEDVSLIGDHGRTVRPDDDNTDVRWFHVVAHTPSRSPVSR